MPVSFATGVASPDFRFLSAGPLDSGSTADEVFCDADAEADDVDCVLCEFFNHGSVRRFVGCGGGAAGFFMCSIGDEDHGIGWLLSSSGTAVFCVRNVDAYPESFGRLSCSTAGSLGYEIVPLVEGSSTSRSMSLSKSFSSKKTGAGGAREAGPILPMGRIGLLETGLLAPSKLKLG